MVIKQLRQAFSAIITPRTKLALVVRADLKMSKGKMAAQCAHASVMCYQRSQDSREKRQLLKAWCFTGQAKVVLRIDSYADIIHIEKKAKEMDVVSQVVKDAGRTELQPGTTTVLGIGPDTEERINKLVAHLRLL